MFKFLLIFSLLCSGVQAGKPSKEEDPSSTLTVVKKTYPVPGCCTEIPSERFGDLAKEVAAKPNPFYWTSGDGLTREQIVSSDKGFERSCDDLSAWGDKGRNDIDLHYTVTLLLEAAEFGHTLATKHLLNLYGTTARYYADQNKLALAERFQQLSDESVFDTIRAARDYRGWSYGLLPKKESVSSEAEPSLLDHIGGQLWRIFERASGHGTYTAVPEGKDE